MKNLLNILAGVLLFLCSITAIAVVVIVAKKYPAEKQTYNIELTVTADSIGHLTKESRVMIDSVMHVVANQGNTLQGKYEALAERETDNQNLMTIGGIIVTIIASILGFFGFRSFQSIEEKAIDKAEGAAKKKLDEEMGGEIDRVRRKLETEMLKRFDEDIKPKVKAEVEAVTDEKFSNELNAKINFINANGDEIKSLRNDVEGLKKKLSDAQDAGLEKEDKVKTEEKPDPAQDEIMDQIKERRGRKAGTGKGKKGGES